MMTAKQLLDTTGLYTGVAEALQRLKRWTAIRKWHKQGRPIPPPAGVKHATIMEYGKEFRLDVLIETGTYLGDTIAAVKNYFCEIYSIELSPQLHAAATRRFAGDPSVHLLMGNSGDILKEVLRAVSRTPLFWLDAHFSGGCTARGARDTPIIQELETILDLCPDCVVLIDDARMFDGTNSYPTLPELRKYVAERAPHWVVEVKNDIIRLHGRIPTMPTNST